MSALSAAEKARLSALHDELIGTTPSPALMFEAGRMLADSLRSQMPDLDDATIGRVAYATISFVHRALVASGTDGHLLPAINAAVDQTLSAALDLSASEWQEAKL